MEQRRPSVWKPALIAGVSFGVAAALPVVSLLNCLCCALIWGCGLLAAFLHSRDFRRVGLAYRAGDGAMTGLVAGIVYGITQALLSIVTMVLMGGTAAMLEKVRQTPNMPAEAERFIERLAETGSMALIVAMIGLFSLLFGALFSTLGGLIGGTLFKVEPPPAPPASGGGSWDVGGPTTGGVAPGGPASPSGWEPPPVR